MSLPTQIAAYGDCFDLFNRAKNDDRGIRVFIGLENVALRLRHRMQMARRLQRDESKRLYDLHAPQWGKSEFDDLVVTVRKDTEGDWWLYIERYGMEIGEIESLSETGT